MNNQKEIARISRYEDIIPKNYIYFDYKKQAELFDQIVFEEEKTGKFLPLIWKDTTYQTFGIPAYIGDDRMAQDGSQEAVTVIASVLSATQIGIDKSNQNGINYVELLSAFFSEEEQIILNNPSGSSESTSMWYLLYPAILFTQVSILYPEEIKIREQAISSIEQWYQAYLVMEQTGSFDYTGFNFKTMKPYKNNIWTEPDCIAGIALLLYYGYNMTGNNAYLEAGIDGMKYLEEYFGSPLYEALLYFAPYLAAVYNAKYETNFEITNLLDDVFNGSSIPRGGWGSITGTWGDYQVNGLMGSTSDGGGYAFAMNTFTAAYALSPLVKYDIRYAAAMGKWYLNLVSNARYFFPNQTEEENQSGYLDEDSQEFIEKTNGILPYEGIRKSFHSKTPWFGGDPTVYGWAETDFSLYSGAHIGLLGGIVEKTDVEGILRIDVNKADVGSSDSMRYFLIYNPYQEEKVITYQIESPFSVDLYNSVTREYIEKKVQNECKITIPKEEAILIIELPADTEIVHKDKIYYADSQFIGADVGKVQVINYKNNDTVSGNFQIQADAFSTIEEDSIKEMKIKVNEQEKLVKGDTVISYSAGELKTGSYTFSIEVTMESGLKDSTQLRLRVEN